MTMRTNLALLIVGIGLLLSAAVGQNGGLRTEITLRWQPGLDTERVDAWRVWTRTNLPAQTIETNWPYTLAVLEDMRPPDADTNAYPWYQGWAQDGQWTLLTNIPASEISRVTRFQSRLDGTMATQSVFEVRLPVNPWRQQYFVMTASNAAGESAFSDVVWSPTAPTPLRSLSAH